MKTEYDHTRFKQDHTQYFPSSPTTDVWNCYALDKDHNATNMIGIIVYGPLTESVNVFGASSEQTLEISRFVIQLIEERVKFSNE